MSPGKRSPDGRFREYKYNREIAAAVVEHLKLRGYDAELLVPEEEDISLELVTGGSLPLPVAEGGHAPGSFLPSTSSLR